MVATLATAQQSVQRAYAVIVALGLRLTSRKLAAMDTLIPVAVRLRALLKPRQETVAVAESSSGGLISAALLAVPGASAYFLGGGVIYTRKARESLLEVPDAAVKGLRSSS